jgi:hypothetical protein
MVSLFQALFTQEGVHGSQLGAAGYRKEEMI